MGNRETYQNRANRDRRARELKAQGYLGVRRSSIRNQLLHPQYVEDAPEHLRSQTGFGNAVYKTHFAALYHVEWGPRY